MKISPIWLAGLLLAIAISPASADTLADVQARGKLKCGVNGALPGLSFEDDKGVWSGFDVDFCRAVAAAALGDADKVEYVRLDNEQRLDALKSGTIDLLARNTSWTLTRDVSHGMSFVGVLYFDGQGFMVPRSTSLLSTLELSGKTVCAMTGSTGPAHAERYFTRHRMELQMKLYPDIDAAIAAYLAGDCDALTTDHSQLFSVRAKLDDAAGHRILPEIISKEPLSPAVRDGETRWFDLVRWTLFTLIEAEEYGISSANLERVRATAKSPQIAMLLDRNGESGRMLGVEPGWGHRVLAAVGNYGEMFNRNLGNQSALLMKRGYNALWSEGGLLFAPPIR